VKPVLIFLLATVSLPGMAQEMQKENNVPQPVGALAWFQQGVELARQGEYAAALNRYTKARSLSPFWALPHLEIAVAHLMTDNDRQIIGDSLAKAVQFGPKMPRARYLYGVFLHEQKKRSQAIKEFVQALVRRPSMLDARFRLATLYVEEGLQSKGIEQYHYVLHLQPTHLGAHRNLAMLYEQSGQLEFAEKHLLAIVRMYPQNAWHLNNLGHFYERMGQPKNAKKAFGRAQRLDPIGNLRNLRPLLKSGK
jgi:Tfp pilus assembly protein PilF